MKIACCGDIHLGEFKDFSKNISVLWDYKNLEFVLSEEGTLINSRLLEAAQCLIDIRKYCEENNIKILLIAGDLFHNRGSVPTIVYNIAYRLLESFKIKGIKIIIIPGNHDQKDNTDYPENSLKPFSWMCTLIDKPCTVMLEEPEENIEILCIPFSKNKTIIMDAVNNYIPDSKAKTHIIMSHLGVCGGLTGTSSYAMMDVFTPEDLRYDDVDFVVLGHYHKAQIIKGTDNKMFYTGSPLQLNFNDEGDRRGFWIIDTKKKSLVFEELKAPKFITVTSENYKNIEESNRNYIKLKLEPKTSQNDINSIMKEIGENLANQIRIDMEREFKQINRSTITFSMSYADIIKQYCKECNLPKQSVNIGLDILDSIK